MVSSFKDVIDRFGGAPRFADAVGMKLNSAKQARKRDSLASHWFGPVIRAAQERGLADITETTLIELAEQRRPTSEAA